MKSTRMVTAAALVFGAALALSGCAAEPAATESSTTTTDACSEVRNITNGALNTLAGDIAADPTAKSEYFSTLASRVDALVGTVENKGADEAFTAFSDALTDASAYALTVVAPAEGAEEVADPALETTMTAVQDAAAEAAANCSAK